MYVFLLYMRLNIFFRVFFNVLFLVEEGEVILLFLFGEDGGYYGKWYKGFLFVVVFKLGILFVVFIVIVGIIFYWGMFKLDDEDKGIVKLLKFFVDF